MAEKIDYFSTSLEKGLKILSLFSKENKTISQTEISKLLGLNMTSTYRYINTFVALGYLEKDSQTKRLRPGLRSMTLCTNLMQATDTLKLIKSEVDRFYKEHKITIDVGLINDETMMSVYRREAEDTMTHNLPVVAANCLHITSTGKAYLSTVPEAMLIEIISRKPLQAKTKHSITDQDLLLKEIRKTKARGYSMTIEEYLPGLISIGAPLISRNSGKCLGAISFDFSIFQSSPEELEQKYAHLIIKLSNSLSELFTDD